MSKSGSASAIVRRFSEQRPGAISGFQVLPNLQGGWSVRQTEAARASRVFKTHGEAVNYARARAKSARTNLFVHRADFTVEEMNSYGSDPLLSGGRP